jgi:hypothetical protein
MIEIAIAAVGMFGNTSGNNVDEESLTSSQIDGVGVPKDEHIWGIYASDFGQWVKVIEERAMQGCASTKEFLLAVAAVEKPASWSFERCHVVNSNIEWGIVGFAAFQSSF